jgi:hypothetical protein
MHGAAVPEELAGLPVLDRPQAVAVAFMTFQELLDPGPRLFAAERRG